MGEDVLPRLPERAALIHFFAERPALPVREAAKLLGWPWRRLFEQAREEEALLPGDRVVWSEVAFRLLHVWPRAALLRELAGGAVLIPRGLHLTPVPWKLPLYLVRAMEAQATLHGVDVQDHVAEALDLMLDDATLETFRNDEEFMAAYEYPLTVEHDG